MTKPLELVVYRGWVWGFPLLEGKDVPGMRIPPDRPTTFLTDTFESMQPPTLFT